MAGVIDVVERHAVKLRHESCPTRGPQHLRHCCPQSPMFARKQLFIRGPCRLVKLAFFGTWEKIAPFQGKRAAFTALDPPSQRVFPVRGVEHHFPDIVAARTRAPGCLPRRHTLQGLSEIWAVPGLLFVGLIQEREYELLGIQRGHLCTEIRMRANSKRIARLRVRVNLLYKFPIARS